VVHLTRGGIQLSVLVTTGQCMAGATACAKTSARDLGPGEHYKLNLNRKVSHAQLGHHCCQHGVGEDSKRFMELTKRLGDIRDHWDQRQWD
jgi:hypothetical protein